MPPDQTTESTSETVATDSAPASPTPSEPSPATETQSTNVVDTSESKSKESLLDAVLKVVPATNETDVLAAPKEEVAETDQPETEDKAETEAEIADDDETLPQDASPLLRKKMNRLLRQRRELRREVGALKAPAEIGNELQNFAKTADLSGDDIAQSLGIIAALRAGDYETFYKAVSPFVRTAQEYLGIVLPTDLAKQVREGQMTDTAAKAFARQRFDGMRAQENLRTVETQSQQQVLLTTRNEVQRAVTNLENRFAASDPDYKAKADLVRRTAQALLLERGNKIGSVKEALELTNAAYAEVNKHTRSMQPRPQATRPQPNGAHQNPSARAAPKTMMEAAMQGLETARRTGG